MKLGTPLNPRATHGNTLVMRSSGRPRQPCVAISSASEAWTLPYLIVSRPGLLDQKPGSRVRKIPVEVALAKETRASVAAAHGNHGGGSSHSDGLAQEAAARGLSLPYTLKETRTS